MLLSISEKLFKTSLNYRKLSLVSSLRNLIMRLRKSKVIEIEKEKSLNLRLDLLKSRRLSCLQLNKI